MNSRGGVIMPQDDYIVSVAAHIECGVEGIRSRLLPAAAAPASLSKGTFLGNFIQSKFRVAVVIELLLLHLP